MLIPALPMLPSACASLALPDPPISTGLGYVVEYVTEDGLFSIDIVLRQPAPQKTAAAWGPPTGGSRSSADGSSGSGGLAVPAAAAPDDAAAFVRGKPGEGCAATHGEAPEARPKARINQCCKTPAIC